MKLHFALLVREVIAEVGSKWAGPAITLRGVMQVMAAHSLPVTPSSLYFVYHLEAWGEEGEEHQTRTRVIDPDGHEVAQAASRLQMHSPASGLPLRAMHHQSLCDLSFHQEGGYTFVVEVDGRPLGEATLEVIRAAA